MSDQPDYDSPWKDILERFFIDFVRFFFPDVHAGIDWEKEYIFMDKELQQLVRDSEIGRLHWSINWSGYTPETAHPSWF